MQACVVCSRLVMFEGRSDGCKSRPVFSLFPFSSRLPSGHCLNDGDFAPNRHFRHFLTPNRPKTTWSVQRRDVCSGPVAFTRGSDGCKSRPVFPLFPFASRFVRCHTLNGGDFGPNRPFRHFLTPNRPRTTWSVQQQVVCIGLV